jgi:hypothetical protein
MNKVKVRVHICGRLQSVGEFDPFEKMMREDYLSEMDSSQLSTYGYVEGLVEEKHLHCSSGLINSPAVDRVERLDGKSFPQRPFWCETCGKGADVWCECPPLSIWRKLFRWCYI